MSKQKKIKRRRVFIVKTYFFKFPTLNFKQRQYSGAGLENILRNYSNEPKPKP